MSKVVKFVVAAGLIVAGAVTGQAQLIMAGIGLGLSALKKTPKKSAANNERLFQSINPRAPRTIVFGNTAMATDICDEELTGSKQDFFHRFVVVASHRVNSIYEIWFDDKLAWTSVGGAQGEYAGYLQVVTRLEGSAANAINISPRMGASRLYTGLAYVHFRFKLTGNSKKSESPFASSVPTRVTIRGEGIAVYEPRQDSTMPGGSGPHRANDQSTWTYGPHARNPALQALTYLLGWKINGKLAVGKGIPPRRIDIASFIDAANICDESISLSGGGAEPRYRGDGVFSEADSMGAVLSTFEQAMDAVFYDPQGRIKIKCFVNDLMAPVATFSDADILGPVSWQPDGDLTEQYNIVRGTYVDPSNDSLYQSIDYPEIYQPSADGIDRTYTLDLSLVQSVAQAQRLAKRKMMRFKYGGGKFIAEMQATAWRVEQHSAIWLNFAAQRMVNKVFRVSEIEARIDGTVPITLQVEDPRIYSWNAEEVQPPPSIPSTPYLTENDPFVIDMPTTAQISRIDPLTGRGLETFQSANAVPYTEILETGYARNGDVITFGTLQSRVPKIIFTVGGNAGSAGNNQVVQAAGLSASGFTMRAVSQSVTSGSAIIDAGSSAGGSGEPDFVINKSNAAQPFDGQYAFSYSVSVGSIGGGEPGFIQIGIFVKKAGIWVQVATDARSASGAYTVFTSPGAVDFGAGPEFGISLMYSEGTGNAISAFNNVKYNTGTVTETSLTPPTASPIQWIAVL